MNLDEILGIDPTDALARRARRLLDADRRLVADLVARRKELGLSQAEVARRMDTSQSVVARIESGLRDMHQSTLRRYAMAVDATIDHVVVPDERAHERSAQMIADFDRAAGRKDRAGAWVVHLVGHSEIKGWQIPDGHGGHWAKELFGSVAAVHDVDA